MLEKIIENYSPVGDNITLMLCMFLLILKSLTYSKKEIKLTVFKWSVDLTLYASIAQLIRHMVSTHIHNFIIEYYLLNFFFICLTLIFMNYMRYIYEAFDLSDDKRMITLSKLIIFPPIVVQLANLLIYPISCIFNIQVKKIEIATISIVIFYCMYWYCIAILTYTLIRYKNNIMHKIWKTFVISASISAIVVVISMITCNISFLGFTFLLPLIAAYNLLHNNPYNIELGTLDANAFESYLLELSEAKKDFSLVCLKLEGNEIPKCLKNIRLGFYLKHPEIFSKNYLFKLNDNKYVFVLNGRVGNDEIIHEYFIRLKEVLDECSLKHNAKYKLNIIKSNEFLDNTKNYINYNKYLENNIKENYVYMSTDEDLQNFIKEEYIKSQLKDICEKNDLNDPRVLVYCQPVYDIENQRYESAEALMRLQLKDTGMVFPDIFIPIAEEYNYIHQLSLIILNKTCQAIKLFEKENYQLSRVSVNFSIAELKQKSFCDDIKKIIEENAIDASKIAIELTENRIEQDFNMIKEKVEELKSTGILFYLDDFGTGYSNFERVLKLPIDIIKFDRSLVIMSNQDQNYKYMVKNFSEIFSKIGYKILFEGIEDDNDEEICIGMKANYLQGYKYSRPIPIEKLAEFLEK